MFKLQNYSFSAQKESMRYNNLIFPLTTLYENLWHQSKFYVSYLTLFDFQEIFSISIETESF